jgi:hypothetical protein
MQEEKINPEISDITEMINRYCASHKNQVCFVASFVAFKDVPKGTKCPDCGEDCEHTISDEASKVFAYGDKEVLRELINELRDIVEDEADDEDFINI